MKPKSVIHPSDPPSVCLFIHPSICSTIHLFVHLSVHPSIHQSIHFSIHICLTNHFSIPSFIHPPIYLPIPHHHSFRVQTERPSANSSSLGSAVAPPGGRIFNGFLEKDLDLLTELVRVGVK